MRTEAIPHAVRVRLIHGVLQLIANRVGVDLLHIKGPAVSAAIMGTHLVTHPISGAEVEVINERGSSDADVWVRPEHVSRFAAACQAAGWQLKTSFTSGSAFGHAMNMYHPDLGNADLHRLFPGIRPDGFDVLWSHRQTLSLGNVDCDVPSVVGQRLVLMVHLARSGDAHPDRERAWHSTAPDEREQVMQLAREVGAEVAMAAALGTLDEFRDRPEHALWQHYSSQNPSRLNEWRAQWLAARGLRARMDVVAHFLWMDPAVLEAELGRRPSARDIARRLLQRWQRLTHEVERRLQSRSRS